MRGFLQIYFDIIEEIDATLDCNGFVSSCDVAGTINSNCKLSGMPDCTLTFTDPSLMDDVAFHPCVRFQRFEAEQTLSFIPPDGKYKLLSYRAQDCGGALPVYVKPSISFNGSSGHIDIMVGPKGTLPKPPEDVSVVVPLAEGVMLGTLNASFGKASFDETTRQLLWRIGRIPKDKTPHLSGSMQLSDAAAPAYPTVSASFRVPGFSVSGLKIDGLTIVNTVAKPYKGVRTITKAGHFQIRTAPR